MTKNDHYLNKNKINKTKPKTKKENNETFEAMLFKNVCITTYGLFCFFPITTKSTRQV